MRWTRVLVGFLAGLLLLGLVWWWGSSSEEPLPALPQPRLGQRGRQGLGGSRC
jgi:hypothetical protein